jgi:diguanylate cyclase (GGDEF)-like protein
MGAPKINNAINVAPLTAAPDGLVARVLDQLPIGLAIRDLDEATAVYVNNAAIKGDPAVLHESAASGERVFEDKTHHLEIEGKRFEVVTSLDATDHVRRENELTRRAFYDELTGLPKRELFEQAVDNMIKEQCGPFALSFIDLDNFKYVNDYYGHAVGDQLLKKVARRISDSMRPTDFLARVGGDEFVLLSTPVGPGHAPAAEIEQLGRRFQEPFFIDGYELFSSASIGVSLYPNHGHDYAVLRANADSAMYRVKATTKGAVALFDASLGFAAAERMETEQRLRLAIRDKRFGCAFQPKFDFRVNRIVGVEVLLRWRDDNGEFRPPGDLIKVAIELGLMDDIAFLVLDQVVAQIDLINDAFGVAASISLNIAAKQAADLAFMTRFAEALRDTGYPHRFMIELTEEAFLAGGEFQLKVLPVLRSIGLRVSIDDFGVGYSSLSALANITADELKIDRSFITDIHKKPRNQSILKVMELLGESLGIHVVVEGVETQEELAYLLAATRINCGQGYYFSKPIFLEHELEADERKDVGSRDRSRARNASVRMV